MDDPDKTIPHGATWPDVALAIVEFAREDTWRFLAVLAAAAAVAAVVWLLFPGLTRRLRADYLFQRSARTEDRDDD